MSLTVSQLEWPKEKQTSSVLSSKNSTRCSGHYRAAHCGPLALTYHLVSLHWPGGKVDRLENALSSLLIINPQVSWNRTHMVVSQDQDSSIYDVEDVDEVMFVTTLLVLEQ